MAEPAIRVHSIGKNYCLGTDASSHSRFRYKSLAETLSRGMRRKGRDRSKRQTSADTDFWALHDVSFDVQAGEVVGIIGRNGAGKSTLLKILSRITEPTRGYADINGRVGSLLEVGTGFHPELTGRENIYLNGAILGMSQSEIKRKFDEIVAFSEVERFLDTPVKHYSSGMYMRLAFAVAAHLDTEILVVDEVLAVGDAEFQKKCLGKMQSVAHREGRTVLFVSHNMAAIGQLTQKCILLKKGGVEYSGDSRSAVEKYLQGDKNEASTVFDVEHTPRKYPGTMAARLLKLSFDRPLAQFAPTEDFAFTAAIRAAEDVKRLRFSITIFSCDGHPVGSCFSPERLSLSAGGTALAKVTLPSPRLAPGRYHCGIAIGKGDHRSGHADYDVVLDTLPFEVVPEEGDSGTLSQWTLAWGRIAFPDLVLETAHNPSVDLSL
jgi:lipopolysaccharide transport system ATP-binding protein